MYYIYHSGDNMESHHVDICDEDPELQLEYYSKESNYVDICDEDPQSDPEYNSKIKKTNYKKNIC